jgi:hypothetical protein
MVSPVKSLRPDLYKAASVPFKRLLQEKALVAGILPWRSDAALPASACRHIAKIRTRVTTIAFQT